MSCLMKFIVNNWINFWLLTFGIVPILFGFIFLIVTNNAIKLIFIFFFGGFAVAFRYWISWLDTRWKENMGTIAKKDIPKVYFKINNTIQNSTGSISNFEMLFKSIHALQFNVSLKNKYFEGRALPFFSLEIHSKNGHIGYFIQCRDTDKNLILNSSKKYYLINVN